MNYVSLLASSVQCHHLIIIIETVKLIFIASTFFLVYLIERNVLSHIKSLEQVFESLEGSQLLHFGSGSAAGMCLF